MRVERLAFTTVALRMRTVGITLDTLESELHAAKREVESIVTEAKNADFEVDDDGQVQLGPVHNVPGYNIYSGVDGARVWYQQQATKLTGRIEIAVRRARRADHACARVLDTVIGADFVSTTTSGRHVLARARDARDAARAGKAYAKLLGRLLHLAHRADAHGEANKEHGYPELVMDIGKGGWEAVSGTVRGTLDLIGLLGLAASGDGKAEAQLAAIPPNVWKELSTREGWEDLVSWEDLEEGRPGEFIGKNLPALLVLLKGARVGGSRRGRAGSSTRTPVNPSRYARYRSRWWNTRGTSTLSSRLNSQTSRRSTAWSRSRVTTQLVMP